MSRPTSETIVLDTNIVSFKYNGDDQYQFYEQRLAGFNLVIAVQTYEEMWFGAKRDKWGDSRLVELERFLTEYELIEPDAQIARACATLRVRQRHVGKTLSYPDAWIVATALTLDCPFASHDSRLAGIPGLKLIQAPDARI